MTQCEKCKIWTAINNKLCISCENGSAWEKECFGCKKTKPLGEFGIDKKRGVGGRSNYCKECRSVRARQLYINNREAILARQKETRVLLPVETQPIREVYRESIQKAIKDNSHLANKFIAKIANVHLHAVIKERERLEQTGEIPIHKELMGEDGRWRHRLRHQNRKKSDPWGCQNVVYFVRDQKEPAIKIGVSAGSRSRVSGLQTGNPNKLIVLAWMPGGRKEEKELQKRFEHLNTYEGEWFEAKPELLAFIEEVKQNHSQEPYIHPSTKEKKDRIRNPAKINTYAAEGKKQCSSCKKVLPFTDFYTDNRSFDSLTCQCKCCAKESRSRVVKRWAKEGKNSKGKPLVASL